MKSSRTTRKASPTASAKQPLARRALARVRTAVNRARQRQPHRSFMLTRRRDYQRALQLPGYWAMTREVWRLLLRNKKLFGLLIVLYIVLSALAVGVASQDSYSQLSDALKGSGQDLAGGNFGSLGQASLLYLSAITGSISNQPDPGQQAYAVFIGLLAWLTIVWLLRAIMAGQSPRLRDGLYSSGGPIMATCIVMVVMVVQAFPIALASLGFTAASTSGLLAGGVEAMLFWTVAALLTILSLYWMTSSFIALVIVTLPGMYPFQALRAAADLVAGRRLRILLRLLWMMLLVLVVWTVIVLPMILFDGWLKATVTWTDWLPLIPYLVLVMSSLTLVFTAGYIYVLYRKVVDDDAVQGAN